MESNQLLKGILPEDIDGKTAKNQTRRENGESTQLYEKQPITAEVKNGDQPK